MDANKNFVVTDAMASAVGLALAGYDKYWESDVEATRRVVMALLEAEPVLFPKLVSSLAQSLP